MNFRPTKNKILISLLIAIVFAFIGYFYSGCIRCTVEVYKNLQYLGGVIGFFIGIILTYIVWSLFQKS
jgi:H+/Cl- antiporter ClcA